jgi:hypothetical protein
MTRPTLSVVVRTYNRADYLRHALDSVREQTQPPDEVVVVDDGSTDATPRIVAEYGVRYERLPHTGNPARVLNAGLRAARGDLVALLDSDDVWLPRKVEQQLGLLQADASLGFVYGNACLLLPDGQTSAPVLGRDQIACGDVLPVVVRAMCVHPSTLMVRRALLERVGPLDETERVALIRRHAQQVTTEHGLLAYTVAIRALLPLAYDPSLSSTVRAEARRTIGRHHAHLAKTLLSQRDLAAARRHALLGLRFAPLHRPAWRWAAAALLGRSL